MSSKLILGIAALACGPVLVHGAAGFILSDETTLHLTGSAQVRFDDNVGLSEHNADSDTIFSIMPGIELDYIGGQTKGMLVLREDFERYASESRFNAELFSGIGELNYDNGLTTVDARVGYREMSQSNISIRNVDQTVRHDLFDASINGIWSATAKTSVGAGVMYDRTNYAGVAYADNQNFSVPLDLYYEVSPKVDVSVGYRFRRSKIDEVPVTPSLIPPLNYDSKDHFFSVGARGEFTPKLKGQFRVGFGTRDFDDARLDNTDQLGLSGALTYAYSPKTSFDFSISNDFSNSALGTSQEVFAVRTGGKFEFTPQWSLQAGLSYEATQYDRSLNSTLAPREDEFFVGDSTLVYAMNESVSIEGSYVFRTNSSNRNGLSFDNNILSLGISLRY